MRSSNAELTIYRNENFTIDRTLVNKDGSPYIINRNLPNPHLLITVSDSKYQQTDQFKINYFLPLTDLAKFNFTQVISLTDLTDSSGNPLYTKGFPDGLTLVKYDNSYSFMTAYYKGDLVRIEPFDAVFTSLVNGVREYKYWKPDEIVEGSGGKWVDYVFRFAKVFPSEDTSKLIEQTYYYGIQLVSGWTKYECLLDLCISNNIYTADEDTAEDLLNRLLLADINVPIHILSDAPIVKYRYIVPILGPTKMSVLSNLEGRML